MEAVLIDTSIVVGRMRGEKTAFAATERVSGSRLLICDVVLAEVLAGARTKVEFHRYREELIANFPVLPFTSEVSMHFRAILASIAPQHQVHLADQLIASVALAHAVPVLTLNGKHFRPIKGLKLA